MVLVEALRGFFAQRERDVAAAWLFGSQARGTARPSSDIDVAVLFRTAPAPTLLGFSAIADLQAELAVLAGGRAVDVVAVNGASADLVHRVLRDGVLLAEHDRAARVRFEVKKRNEYFDLKPMLDRIRRRAS